MIGSAACTAPAVEQEEPQLEYRRAKWLAGLQESVTVIKTERTIAVERADGSLANYAEIVALDRARYQERFGAGTPELNERLERAASGEPIDVAFQFELPELASILELGGPRELRRQRIAQAVAAATEPIAAWLAPQGFIETYRSQFMPALFGTLPAEALRGVVHDPRFDRIALNERSEGVGNGEYAVLDPIVEHSIDTTWNTCAGCGSGNYGEGVHVGMIEWCGYDAQIGGRALFETHDAFEHLSAWPVHYMLPPAECTLDEDCAESSDDGCDEDQVKCIGGICMTLHGSQVASVISASKSGTPSGAAKIKLTLSNGSKPSTTAGYAEAYDRLANVGAEIVNETHGGLTFGDGLQVADYFARVLRMTPVQSAGNAPSAACPKSANSICVGATTAKSSLDVAWYSATTNPPGTAGDREEPDVTAFGGDDSLGADLLTVIGFSSASDWSGANAGTSYSAPVVTNMLAHYLRDCVHDDPMVLRATVRTAAWAGNPAAWDYSTPAAFWDHLDGGGWVDAPALNWFCNLSGGNDGGAGIVNVDLTRGSDPEGTSSGYRPGDPPPQVASLPLNYTPAHDPSFARKEYVLAERHLRIGDRVRFTISWDACATDKNASTTAPVDIDLDLFLLNRNTGEYVYGSQSIDDNNEGFDVRITEQAGEGRYRVVYTRPLGQETSCGSSALNLGWAGRWGAPW